MKRNLFCSLLFALTLALCAAPLPFAFAGQSITIDTDVDDKVYGNGPGPYGTLPPDAALLNPNENTIVVDDSTIDDHVYGAYANSPTGSATATGNSATVNGSEIDGDVYGAHTSSDNGSATATGNSVSLTDSTAGYAFGGYADSPGGGSATVTATGNSVIINGGKIYATVGGGYANTNSGSATASGNSVIINAGGEVDWEVYGGDASSWGGSATASGNSVTINGGTANDDVYGGFAGSTNASATSTGNSVIINGGTVNGNIYGGHAKSDSGSTTATGNTVTISGNTTFAANSGLYGGYALDSGDDFTGNTLNLHSVIRVADVQNFQYLNFYLPTAFMAGDTMLTVDGSSATIDLSKSTVNVGIEGGSSPLAVNDQITLIDASATTGLLGPLNSTANGQGMQGVTLRYEFDLSTDSNQLLATVRSLGLNPQTKALSEGFLSGLALTTQGADVIAGQGMGNAVSATAGGATSGTTQGVAGGNGFGAFGALSGGSLRYDTGSHVDMNSVSLMTGLAWGVDTPGRLGRMTLGAFLEYGNGSYDTHNSFSNSASVDGDGDSYYLGGGILGRMDFANSGPGHWYAEVSARIGEIHNEYDSSDLRDGMGRSADFDSSSLYYGLHFGTGYIWNITDKASLDLYGKYFWTRQEGDAVTLSTNDPVIFKDADSHRLRGGARFAYAINEYITPYIGAAYEHEFDGEARATTYGHSMDAPSLRGDTGIGEIGVTLKPSATLPLSFDLGVQGYTGKREGVTGSVQVKLEF